MRVVAVTELKGSLEAAASSLAVVLGVSAYDVRTRLAGPLPKVLCQTADDDVARRVQREVTALGHSVIVCDASAVVATSQMVRLHRFHFDAGGLFANDRAGERLAWSDLGLVAVVVLRSQVSRTTEEVEYLPTMARSAPTITHEVTKTEHGTSHAAYLFPHAGAVSRRPWVLEETSAQFLSLGPKMQPTRRANFLTMVATIRSLAPHAIFDDRFVAHPLASHGAVTVRGNDAAPPPVAAPVVDLTLHVLAGWLLRDHRGPYRG